jgi:hypothetical protein
MPHRSPAELTPALDLLAGLGREIGQWWPALTTRWSKPAPRAAARQTTVLPPPL